MSRILLDVFEKGKFYTIVVTGLAKGLPKLQTLMVEDQLTTAATTSTNLQEKKMTKTKASKYLAVCGPCIPLIVLEKLGQRLIS